MSDKGYIINAEAIEAVNTGEEIPEELEVNGAPAFRLEYHSTDAWRGYYNAIPVEGSGFEKLTDEQAEGWSEGWVTGDYEDAPAEARSSNLEARLDRLAEKLATEGYELAVVFAPTSNVFSTSYDLFRRPADLAKRQAVV